MPDGLRQQQLVRRKRGCRERRGREPSRRRPRRERRFVHGQLDAGLNDYLVFGAAKISGGTGGAVVLQTSDLKSFVFASALGYARQVMNSPAGRAFFQNGCDTGARVFSSRTFTITTGP